MSRELRADYTTQFLFPPALEDWVKADDPARYIRAFVDSLDLKQMAGPEWAEATENPDGRPHYAFDLLLKVWLYGYLYNIRSSRKLERACRQMMPLVWLAGRFEPDHNTLWRFWKRYRHALKKVFVQSVRVALEANLVGMVLQAIDGTKIVSAASQRKGWHRADLQKILTAIDERIDQLEREIAAAQEGSTELDERLPKKLQNETQLRARVREALQTLETAEREHMHPHDPEARMMKGGTAERIEFAYNAQAVCDASHGIVVAEAVVEDANDQQQLGPMLAQVQQNTGGAAEQTLADRGYDTAESLAKAEELNAPVIVAQRVNPEKVGAYHLARFIYDEQAQTVHCPIGQQLRKVGPAKHHQKPHPLMRYRCDVWASCPVGKECSNKGPRVVEIGPHYGAVQRQRVKMSESASKKYLRRRSEIIERFFGQTKGNDSFQRWAFKGKVNVAAQWTMICITTNLRKLIAALRGNVLAPA
ncbi:MAG: IS1182 family transposase [Acidobacteriota bacterium]|nr:IS1182 family transposase [Acidobacteriota bacterium]